ncbi:MAG: histidine phosphatase family protein [Krumholzibacteria bacterium]|nr:histidine phosphatase family protein [Candidatus Krumholzibacteria bacterium]
MASRLYFVRHGRADRAAWTGDDDDERPLTPAGRRRLARQAETVAGLDLGVDLILTSPLVRARQTAAVLAAALDPPGGVVVEPQLGFGFDVAALAELLAVHGGADRILLVGHEPSFSTVIGGIVGGARLTCRKASLIRVDLDTQEPPRGSLEWSVPPRLLAGD